ncbi:hypothetical protein GUJ93_ZPchr0001g29829 [Zizania palustris]|uniref:Uncharacterized protein n=1 Tax=Zizania palustris TaxID=103762 RepID=A0A8J5RN97_ZIZPA|nr:hypothetical protein GUJ93_ZPchr0001g29829 [Zizania palustris]
MNVSLDDQLSWFEKSKHSLCHNRYGDSDCFRKSQFIVGEFGANDYSSILYSNMTLEEATAYVPKIIDTIANGVEVGVDPSGPGVESLGERLRPVHVLQHHMLPSWM